MAQPTNTYDEYSAIGNREDLEDVIYDISPVEVPFMSNAARMKASNTTHEWQTDALTAAAANRQITGDDATGLTVTPTVRLSNQCQISTKVIITSGTNNAIVAAGRSNDEQSYQIVKFGKELKRDMEYALTQNQASSLGGSATARSTASTESWLTTNKTSAGTGTAQTTPGFSGGTVAAPTDSTVAGTLTEALTKAILQSCWTNGGNPTTIMTGAFNKTKVSGFAGISTQYTTTPKNAQTTIIGAADVYVSDFGVHNVVPNRFSRAATALILDFDYLGVAYLRPFHTEKLAKTGDSEKEMLIVEYALVMKNEGASGKVSDLTVA